MKIKICPKCDNKNVSFTNNCEKCDTELKNEPVLDVTPPPKTREDYLIESFFVDLIAVGIVGVLCIILSIIKIFYK